jgi:tetratricopeptide (TPR) repeat protein
MAAACRRDNRLIAVQEPLSPPLDPHRTDAPGADASDINMPDNEQDDPQLLMGMVPGLPFMAGDEAGQDALAPFAALPPTDLPMRDDSEKLNAAASARYSTGDYSGAIDLLRRVWNLNPDSAAAHNNLAIVLWRAKRDSEAELHCRRAIALNPNYVFAHKLMAEMMRQRNDAIGALACYDRVVALEPDGAMAHNNAGLVLRNLGRFAEAEAAFARALALKPDDVGIRFNQLMMRRDDVGLPEAIECCRQSLEQMPNNADVLTNLAIVLLLMGRYEQSLAEFERAITMNPDNFATRANLSLLLLLLGDYERGWREYERRWDLFGVRKPNFAQPLWEGEELDGRRILLHHEQGLGDTIQCLRYAPLVAARGGRVVLRLERTLVRLAARLPDGVVISPPSAPLPEFDVWCPLLSLPRIFSTRIDTIPATVPYLGARPPIVERWRRRLAGLPGLKVGLVWGGSPRHLNDFRRSIDVARLQPMLDIPDVSYVSLQAGPRAADLAALPPGAITNLSAELTDFTETAGAILNLDLLIAVDTSVAHLAGALARPAWVMLPFSPDWRWMLEREDSLWYPTLRLYRQPRPGDWDDVIARVAADLRERAAACARGADTREGESTG